MDDLAGTIIIVVGALSAVASAFVAARAATRTTNARLQAERILELEKRLSSAKEDLYRPMLEMLRRVYDSAATVDGALEPGDLVDTLSKFWMWIQIYGSDQALRAAHKFSQALNTEPPPSIMNRYLNELVLAIRRDLGDPESTATLVEMAGLRLTDIHDPEHRDALIITERELWDREDWEPPWGGFFGEGFGPKGS